MRPKGLGKFKEKFIHLIGLRTRDLLVSNKVLQPLRYRMPPYYL
jgi:hypothetical protein